MICSLIFNFFYHRTFRPNSRQTDILIKRLNNFFCAVKIVENRKWDKLERFLLVAPKLIHLFHLFQTLNNFMQILLNLTPISET